MRLIHSVDAATLLCGKSDLPHLVVNVLMKVSFKMHGVAFQV